MGGLIEGAVRDLTTEHPVVQQFDDEPGGGLADITRGYFDPTYDPYPEDGADPPVLDDGLGDEALTEPLAESMDGWPDDPDPDDPSPLDLPDPPEVPDWGGWILDNLDKVVLALIVLYLISTLGPGLAETAQAAGGN